MGVPVGTRTSIPRWLRRPLRPPKSDETRPRTGHRRRSAAASSGRCAEGSAELVSAPGWDGSVWTRAPCPHPDTRTAQRTRELYLEHGAALSPGDLRSHLPRLAEVKRRYPTNFSGSNISVLPRPLPIPLSTVARTRAFPPPSALPSERRALRDDLSHAQVHSPRLVRFRARVDGRSAS